MNDNILLVFVRSGKIVVGDLFVPYDFVAQHKLTAHGEPHENVSGQIAKRNYVFEAKHQPTRHRAEGILSNFGHCISSKISRSLCKLNAK